MTKKNITPKISIITVCFNAKKQLLETIDNVAKQTYSNIEHIIIDGGSTDGSKELIKSRAINLTYWVSETDSGIYDAMNKGVNVAKGEWVIFMNAGDTFVNNHVVTSIVLKLHDVDVIYGDVKKNNKICKPHIFKNSHRMCFCHQSSFTRISCLKSYPFDTNYKMSADFKFFKQLGKVGKHFRYINIPIANFDTTGISNTNRAKGLRENIDIVWNMDGIIDKFLLLPRLYFVYLMCLLRLK